MPDRLPIVVLADDLTGAAELAAIGHQHGLRSVVMLEPGTSPDDADLIVFDTDSRLLAPADAARHIRFTIEHLSPAQRSGPVFKKTDSVLRGPVVAELEAAASVLALPRILLAPANPSLGRAISHGRYSIDGQPLAHTSFARDPHHPAHSSIVTEILGNSGTLPITVARPQSPLPPAGLIVGESSSLADTAHWAAQLDPHTLAAGGADFFRAFLKQHVSTRPTTDFSASVPNGPHLIVSGTTSTAGQTLRQVARSADLPVHPLPSTMSSASELFDTSSQTWANDTHRSLTEHRVALALVNLPFSDDPHLPALIRRAFARLTGLLDQQRAFHHLIVEGGATATGIARTLGWRQLSVVNAWAPGVVLLQPLASPEVLLTLKPGSYAWPPALWATLSSPSRSTSTS